MLCFAVLEDLPSSMKMNCSCWIICTESDFLRWGYCYKSANGFVVLIKVLSFVMVLSLPLWIATPRLHTATCSLLRAMMSTWYASPRVVMSWLARFNSYDWCITGMCSRLGCPSNGFPVVVFEKTTSWDKLLYSPRWMNTNPFSWCLVFVVTHRHLMFQLIYIYSSLYNFYFTGHNTNGRES